MTVLILGNASDAHAAHVYSALKRLGVSADYWDTSMFPTQMQVSWSPVTQTGTLTLPSGRQFELDQIRSVFWRSFTGIRIPSLPHESVQHVAQHDATSTIRSLLQLPSTRWVNSWRAYQFHKEKPLQLSRVHHLEIKIPDTLITNNPTEVETFVQQHPKTIFKPVYGGAHTQFVAPEHLQPERLRLSLKVAPVTLQEYISGTNIRTYVIGETVYAAEIRSPEVDFRDDEDAILIPLTLPDKICQQSIAIARALFLEWTAIDWRLTPAGEYVFLEANPSPMFIHFEQQTQFPITQTLIELLTR
jgi:glutathione synthase/RimK-type ligase-like ATP-grasp enzyme